MIIIKKSNHDCLRFTFDNSDENQYLSIILKGIDIIGHYRRTPSLIIADKKLTM